MRSSFAFLCVTLAVFVSFFICISAVGDRSYESDPYPAVYEDRLPIVLSWLVDRYDSDRIEEYVDEYYLGRYKYWESYLVGKQKEFAERFGLSDIFFRPDFRCYDKTKIALTRRLWSNRLRLRYIAPVGNLRDCELSLELKPYKFATFIMRSQLNGESRVALVINRPLGRDKSSENSTRKLRKLLGRARKIVD